MPEHHQKGDFTLAGTTLTFPRSFHKECNGMDSCDLAWRWEALYSENASVLALLALVYKRGLTKVFKRKNFRKRCYCSMIFAMSVIYQTKGKHSREREHPLSTLRSVRFHAGNSCIKI